MIKQNVVLKEKTLALFFTRGISLKEWDKRGLLSREVALYNRLAKSFKKIYFFTYGGKEDLNYQEHLAENIVVVPNTTSLFRNKNLYSFMLPFVHKNILKQVDILKTNQMDGSWAAVITKKLFKKPLVVRTGYTWSIAYKKEKVKYLKKWIVKLIEKTAYSNADAVIVTSQESLAHADKNYCLKQKTLTSMIPNFVDINLFRPMALQKKSNSLCFVGRLAKEKNLEALLEALKDSSYLLDIIGSGEKERNLKLYAKENDLNVNFLGVIPNRQLPEVLNQYEVFILTSFYEGMPKVLLEAMACGLPVIGTNVEGIKEVIVDGENGLLCDITSNSIRKAIDRLFEDDDLREKLSERARETIINKFALERIIETELNLYSKLL